MITKHSKESVEAMQIALRNAPNWFRESFGDFKDRQLMQDNHPLGASDMLRGLLAERDDLQVRIEELEAERVVISGLPLLWLCLTQSDEPQSEFDTGYEQASRECAEALDSAMRSPMPPASEVKS